MTRAEFVKKWRRQLLGEFTDFAFHKDGPKLADRLADLNDWLERTIGSMAEDSKDIQWPPPLANNGQPAKKEPAAPQRGAGQT